MQVEEISRFFDVTPSRWACVTQALGPRETFFTALRARSQNERLRRLALASGFGCQIVCMIDSGRRLAGRQAEVVRELSKAKDQVPKE